MAFVNSTCLCLPLSSSSFTPSHCKLHSKNNTFISTKQSSQNSIITCNLFTNNHNNKHHNNINRRTLLISLCSVSTIFFNTSNEQVLADHTVAAARRSFDRYHPRILSAVDTIRSIGQAVSQNDISTAASLINDKLFYVKGRNAFDIYAGVFSDNYVTNETRRMKKDTEALFIQLDKISKAQKPDEIQAYFDKALLYLNDYFVYAKFPRSELGNLKVVLPDEE